MRPASAAPSISEGASNHAVATPSTTRQSVPISVMPGTVEPIPDELPLARGHPGPKRGSVLPGALVGDAVGVGDVAKRLGNHCAGALGRFADQQIVWVGVAAAGVDVDGVGDVPVVVQPLECGFGTRMGGARSDVSLGSPLEEPERGGDV